MKKIVSVILSSALMISTVPAVPYGVNAEDKLYEFENGTIVTSGDNSAEITSLNGASGGKAVNLKDAGNSVTVTVDAEKAGMHKLTIRYSQPFDEGGKYQNIRINGESIGQVGFDYTEEGNYNSASITANLNQGENSVTVESSWGWTYIDSLTIENYEPPVTTDKISKQLSNKNASAQTQALYSYLCDTYGNYVISGQQESTWMGSEDYEFNIIYNASGKYPALRGLDYMNDDFDGVNRRAKTWYEKGGIVTICWHCGSDFSGSHSESLSDDLNWDAALTEGTSEYNTLIAGMDKGAKALKELEDAGIPVIWRPFHEFDGKWFWWGKGGADNFKKLWCIMYDRYTNYWGLDNLIWNLGYCGDVSDGWYPGDEYVDVIGADTYVDHTNFLANMYYKTADVANKPVCLHENGPIPDPDKMKTDGAKWLWFMTWHTTFIDSNELNTSQYLKQVYNSDYVLTLDELPDIYHYETATGEETTSSVTEPARTAGDVNADGEFNISDVVLLQGWLLRRADCMLSDWKAGDICEDDKLNVYDICLMKRMLMSK